MEEWTDSDLIVERVELAALAALGLVLLENNTCEEDADGSED